MNKYARKIIRKVVNNKHIKNWIRQGYIKEVISNIGDIVETEDSITCYVDQKKFDKSRRKRNQRYHLQLNGMNTHYEKSKNVVNKFKLNKPVYYVFENITFDSFIKISSYFANITFKNCTFDMGLDISADNVTFENNKYRDWSTTYINGNETFLVGSVTNLRFINENFVNSYEYRKESRFGIKMKSDTLEIVDSKIITDKDGEINFKAKNTKIKDSDISSPEIYIDTENIKSNSRFTSTRGIIIDSTSHDLENCVFDTPVFMLNGVEIPMNNGKNIIVDSVDIKEELINARLEVVEYLTKLRDICNKETVEKILKKDGIKG